MAIKKVLITGASRGIGLAIANKLANQYELILHATNEQSFTRPIPNSSIISADFSDPEQVTAFCKRLKKEHGDELYAIINNAGVTLDNSIIFQSEKDIDKMLNVNLKAPIMICKTAMKIFNVRKKGVIINVGSVIGETGNAFQSIYAATKAGLVAFSKSLAKEAAALNDEHEIRVLSIAPGFIATDMTSKLPEVEKQKYFNAIAAKRYGKVEEVAELVSFLLSEQSAYINGTNIHINGGLF